MRCEEARIKIIEQTLEGGLVPTAGLASHLHGCPDCRDLLARVTLVDGALRALPVEQMPAWSMRRIIARPAVAWQRQEPFLPWTLWLPVGSLLIGLLWAYVTLIWPAGSAMIRSVDPAVVVWLARFEEWVATQQAMLKMVALSIGMGLIFTVLAVSLGLYMGRERVAARHGQ